MTSREIKRPRLVPPVPSPVSSYRPPRFFSRGVLDTLPKKNPLPIPYLLIETREDAHPRPVPGQPLLLRSLCKGKGVLKRDSQGMFYLDIDDRFITAMIPFLKAYGLIRPPYFNFINHGAHIPVITSRESTFHFLREMGEIGNEYSFAIEGLFSIEPTLWPEVEQVWFFQLRSPSLEALRQRYFLTATPGCHAFHIAVAIKPRVTASQTPHLMPIMRINPAYLAA